VVLQRGWKAIVKEINDKKIINSLLKLTGYFSSVPPSEETNLVLPISQETITIINQQSLVSRNPNLSPNKCFVNYPETVEDNSLISNDSGNWNTLTEEKRNIYIRKGPKFFSK